MTYNTQLFITYKAQYFDDDPIVMLSWHNFIIYTTKFFHGIYDPNFKDWYDTSYDIWNLILDGVNRPNFNSW